MPSDHTFPYNAAILRFGLRTPFWPLTMSYGMFADPNLRVNFVSPEHYVGYHMFSDPRHRESIVTAPNGYIAYRTTLKIAESDPDAVIREWPSIRVDVMRQAITLKCDQSTMVYDLLMKTGNRPIFDDSRDDLFWCSCGGNGQNQHGTILEEIRKKRIAEDPRYNARS